MYRSHPPDRILLIAAALLSACSTGVGDPENPCKPYVACAVRTGIDPSTLDPTYGASGSCWSIPDAGVAETCMAVCTLHLTEVKAEHPDAGC